MPVIIRGRLVCNFCGRDMGYVFGPTATVHACSDCASQESQP